MFEDEYGNLYSQCINCESVYLVSKSSANIPTSYCSAECEDDYKQFVNDLYDECYEEGD